MKIIIGVFIIPFLILTAIPVYGLIDVGNQNNNIKPISSPRNYIRFMFFDMNVRSYRIHIPPSYDGTNPFPLLLALHGYTQNSKNFMFYTELNEEADEEEFIVIYPNGGTDISFILYCFKLYGVSSFPGFYWNSWDSYDFDDVGFIREIINSVQSDYNIDLNRIYVTGYSNGGMMAYRLGSELSDIVAAIAPVAGSIGGVWDYWNDVVDLPLYIIPEPEDPLPVIVFHGWEDESVPYGGLKNPETDEILLYSVNESVAFWVDYNNCNLIPKVEISESENIIKTTYTDGIQNTEVVLYTIVDGVHEWFGSTYSPCEISCNDLMWDFFESHPKQ